MKNDYLVVKKNVRSLLKKYNISPNKEFGQCFILNWEYLQREIAYANILNTDTILEIGAGIGNLTELLARKAKKVIAIEIDHQFKNILSELQDFYGNIDVIYANALEIDFPPFNKIVSNLPFKISLPLIFKFLDYNFDTAILICQKRLAHRISAKSGQKRYSRLSVQFSRLTNIELLNFVPRNSFFPLIEIDASIIRINKIPQKFKIPSDYFFKEILKFLFTQRDYSINNIMTILRELDTPTQKIDEIQLSIPDYLYYKKIYSITPNEFGELTWIFWNSFGDDIIPLFYKYYNLKNLYKKQ
ncbi:MAG: 16S rRNA (adenine(1518)-N(6)/adenine(1519)-N(6))-dimethyltransferase RsmA [Candidatus Helarchaeota archaeon]